MVQALHQFSVPFHFPVFFTRNAWHPDNRIFVDTVARLEPERRHRVLVIIDNHVASTNRTLVSDIERYFAAHADRLSLATAPVIAVGGEASKNDLSHTLFVLKDVNDFGIDRQSFIVAIGGGAMLDMVSFAAAIAHRGIRVIRFPTTVLSQADSGIAVKNGVNLFGKKNFMGTFVPPFAVVNDAALLESLDHRDRIAGVVEAVKVALLKDAMFYHRIELAAGQIATGDLAAIVPVIQRSAELHLAHICGNGDPFELGSARPLDFGHWAAHKLESITAHRLRHGEAVAIGIALDLEYSVRMGYLERAEADRILGLLERIGFALWDDALVAQDGDGRLLVLRGLQEFREHLGGTLHITQLKGIGRGFEVNEMDEAAVLGAIEGLRQRSAQRLPRMTTGTRLRRR
jgi:3-dehydroquinate synthase